MSKKEKLCSYILIPLLGFIVPLLFIFLDSYGQQQVQDLDNILSFINKKSFYFFSLIFFPLTAIIFVTYLQKQKIKASNFEESFEYLKVVLNSSPEAIIFLDENKKMIFQNNTFKLLFTNLDDVIETDQVSCYFSQIDHIQKETHLKSNVADDHPFLMSFKQTNFRQNKYFFISLKDLKNIKEKEFIIQSQRTQIVEQNKFSFLGEMAAGIAHEINNPLTVIYSTNLLFEKALTNKSISSQKLIELINKSKKQIVKITDIITSLRNLSSGMNTTEQNNFSLTEVIKEAISLAKVRDRSKTIIFQFYPKKEFSIFGNRGEILQVFINLLNNSIDELEKDTAPWITIKIIEDPNIVQIRVTDSGEGISSSHQEKIFLPMFSTKNPGQGTGLGLSLSKAYVEKSNGQLTYLADQKNTCFQLSFPTIANQSEQAHSKLKIS